MPGPESALNQAKAEKPGEPAVAALEPATVPSGSDFADVASGPPPTVTQQLVTALDG